MHTWGWGGAPVPAAWGAAVRTRPKGSRGAGSARPGPGGAGRRPGGGWGERRGQEGAGRGLSEGTARTVAPPGTASAARGDSGRETPKVPSPSGPALPETPRAI